VKGGNFYLQMHSAAWAGHKMQLTKQCVLWNQMFHEPFKPSYKYFSYKYWNTTAQT
jgi:hypothetical protein